MNTKFSIFVVGTLIVVFVYIFSSYEVSKTISFADIEVKSDVGAIDQLAHGYITLPSITADEDSIVNLIGAIAVRTRLENDESWTYIFNYRPARELIQSKIVDEELFHGIISINADFGGRFKIASGNTSSEELAETTIRNQLIVGYRNPADIPYKDLSKIDFSPSKDYFFIASVVVTDITTRRFRKHTGEGKVEGMAFSANGAIFSERDAVKRQKVVSFLPVNPLDLQVSESGGGTDLTQLTAKSRRERLSSSEANTLIKKLVEKANAIAPDKITLGPAPGKLPDLLREMEVMIWIDDLHPIRQSTENRCWAAATAMLFSWKEKRQVSEIEAITSLGSTWETPYKRDKPLPRSYKLDFLSAAKFNYSAPQSYTPNGLISLLKENGPIWFTVDKEFSRHATILTGVFFDRANNSYWITYIDPSDARLKADSYASYMHRYEAPAFRANEEGAELVMTEKDLDIQVIHW